MTKVLQIQRTTLVSPQKSGKNITPILRRITVTSTTAMNNDKEHS